MKAAVIHEHGDLDVVRVEDLEEPKPGPGEVVLKVLCAGLNHLDLWVRKGRPGAQLQTSHVLGSDAVGTVAAVGDGVESPKVGEQVILNPALSCGHCEFCLRGEQSTCVSFGIIGLSRSGTFAELVAVPAGNCYPRPAHLSDEEAGVLALTHVTAWRMLMTRAQLKAGETVLIHGIGGGAALAALQLAKLIGAEVFVTSSANGKLSCARRLGADHTLNYRKESVVKWIEHETSGRGVDVAVDAVGAATWPLDFACRPQGRPGRSVRGHDRLEGGVGPADAVLEPTDHPGFDDGFGGGFPSDAPGRDGEPAQAGGGQGLSAGARAGRHGANGDGQAIWEDRTENSAIARNLSNLGTVVPYRKYGVILGSRTGKGPIMVMTASTMLPLGTEAPDFTLPDAEGNLVSLSDFDDARALVVVFMCNHCPFVKHVIDGFVKLVKEYQPRGVAAVGINANDVNEFPEDRPEKMIQFAQEKGFTFPYLYDETQDVAKEYHAACTPDFFVFDENRRLVYRGQMDDSRPGSQRAGDRGRPACGAGCGPGGPAGPGRAEAEHGLQYQVEARQRAGLLLRRDAAPDSESRGLEGLWMVKRTDVRGGVYVVGIVAGFGYAGSSHPALTAMRRRR